MEYLKRAQPRPAEEDRRLRDTVSEILLAVERDGISAVRRYSERFDAWNPDTFRVSGKAIGTNHVLPTRRAARYTGGLWVGKFIKTVTYQRVTDQGNCAVVPAAAAISDAEGMAGHAITARLRYQNQPERVSQP